ADGTARPDAAYVAVGDTIWWRDTAGNFTAPGVALPGAITITSIVMDPANWETAYAADDKHLYVTTDHGQHWYDITGQPGRNGALPADGIFSLELVKVMSPTGGKTDPNIADLQIQLKSGSFNVNLANATTFGDVKAAIERASMLPDGTVRVTAEPDNTG